MDFIKALLLVTDPKIAALMLSIFYVLYGIYEKRLVNLMFIFIFISGCLNTYLKFIFKVSLNHSLNNHCWYSFPSGHMQYGIVFWGMLLINSNFNKRLFVLFSVLLVSSGIAMNYNNYHSAFEMLGALPAAAIILFLYNYSLKTIDLSKNNLLTLNAISIILQCITLYIVESPCVTYKFNWMWLNLGLNLGFVLNSFFYKNKIASKIPLKIIHKLKTLNSYFLSALVILLLIISQQLLLKSSMFELSCFYGMIVPPILLAISNIKIKIIR